MKILALITVLLLVQPACAGEQAELECALHISRIKGIVHERYNNTLNKKKEDRDTGIVKVFDILDREKGMVEALTARFGACFADKYITALVGEIRIRIF